MRKDHARGSAELVACTLLGKDQVAHLCRCFLDIKLRAEKRMIAPCKMRLYKAQIGSCLCLLCKHAVYMLRNTAHIPDKAKIITRTNAEDAISSLKV
jgi:hypothetical protein